jgi:hypothetical protein
MELLGHQTEAHDRECKRILDIQNDPRHKLKLVKSVAAMSALGGDILVGVDPHGKPTGQVTSALAQVYDTANLRGKWTFTAHALFSSWDWLCGHSGPYWAVLVQPPSPANCDQADASPPPPDAASPQRSSSRDVET